MVGLAADRARRGVGAPDRDQRGGLIPAQDAAARGLAPDPQEVVEHRDLAMALAKLPPKQAAAIVLRHYHGYTNRAIAQALGIPERTVASRLAVAKERLRVMLKHSYGPQALIEESAERGYAIAD